jgi:signal transduction histidine kinase
VRRPRLHALILVTLAGGLFLSIQKTLDFYEAIALRPLEQEGLKTLGFELKMLRANLPESLDSLKEMAGDDLIVRVASSTEPWFSHPVSLDERVALLGFMTPVMEGTLREGSIEIGGLRMLAVAMSLPKGPDGIGGLLIARLAIVNENHRGALGWAMQSVALWSAMITVLFLFCLRVLYKRYNENGLVLISAKMNRPDDRFGGGQKPQKDAQSEALNPNLPHQRVHQLTHEIKNPLTGIRLAAKAMMDLDMEGGSTLYPVQIVSQVDRIQRVVDRMLLLASLEQKQRLDVRQRASVADILDHCLVDMKPLLKSHALRVLLDVDATLTIHADLFLMAMLFENVMANAIDYSPSGSSIHVVIEQKGLEVKIEIRDEGPGIPEALLGRVHEVFVSFSTPNRDHPGTGLGLSIVSEIVGLHGGTWTLANHPLGGAMATILLPIARAEGAGVPIKTP